MSKDYVVNLKNPKDTPQDIADKLNTLSFAIDATVIRGAVPREEFDSLSKVTKKYMDGQKERLNMNDQRWHGGGISRVVHDATLTGEGTTASPLSAVGSGSGTVTTISVASANGFSGTVASASTTPVITINASGLDAAKIANGSVSNTEFQYLDGVTSSIQTQLSGKVSGPASSTDNAFAIFDGTTGELIQNTAMVFNDISGVNRQILFNENLFINFNNTGDGFGFIFNAGDGVASNSSGGILDFFAGSATSGNAIGGEINMLAGNGSGSGNGGPLILDAGNANQTNGTGAGGAVSILAGNGGKTSGVGGSVSIFAGDGVGGNANGGDIVLQAGLKNGSGADGNIKLRIPSSSSIEAILDISLIASTDKTFTFPNATGTISLIANTETLTNKTLTAPLTTTITPTAGYTYDIGTAGVPFNNGWFGFSVNIQSAGINTEIIAGANGTNQIITLPLGTDTIVARASTDTLTNKRIQPRTVSSTTASGLNPDLSVGNVYYRTTQTATLTVNAPIGTPVIGETIIMYVDSAGSQTLNMNGTYIAFGTAFPATTTAGKTLLLNAQYNGTNWKTWWSNQA